MPLAVTHVLLTIILVDLYRDYISRHRKYFTLHTILIAGIGGILPDIDVPLSWLLNFFGYSLELLRHGGITHTPLFGLIFLIPAFFFARKKRHKISMYFFVIAFGVLFHLFLDIVVGGGGQSGIMLFWPLSDYGYKIDLLSKLGLADLPQAIDALILIAWLYHEEVKHKIKGFI